uniref:Hexosyltransferase n=1 Tax=Chenopodium quinoa TaxID=63459 RepID=A0A803KX48_CHEQI
MSSFTTPNETRQRSYVSIEDIYKRKLHRSKAKDTEKQSNISILDNKGVRTKLPLLKLALLIIVSVTFITIFLHSPAFCGHHHLSSHSISRPILMKRWIWGSTDPRYTSHLQINWDDISKVLDKLNEKEYHSIGLLNFNKDEIKSWNQIIPELEHTVLNLDYAEENVTWEALYPEWIDEEEEKDVPFCPSLPKLEPPRKRLDLIVVKLPCQVDQQNCCKELVKHEGNAWLYKPNLNKLREKLQLPVGSCELALPLKDKEMSYRGNPRREAYATILHSAHVYVCGAIAAAQSIRMVGSTRDLVILVDESISDYHRSGLEAAGWKIRTIQRIRNPKAEKDAYNEWNYSKFRLWQLTDYDKIIFIDADLLILRNMDFLFSMPEISATGNDATLFNSGVMVIEPSNCTFQLLMDHINEIESYNGGDQGYLNEIFTWWHRIPRHMNFLKHFWVGDEEEKKQMKTRLFGAEPSILYVLHYLGIKPWLCHKDYDCNWNTDFLQEFASDVAHARWWKVHDAMPENLQQFCLLRTKQKAQIEWDRRQAEKGNYSDGHWKIAVKDKRMKKCIDKLCNWKGMLKHWGETNWTDDEPIARAPPAIKVTPLSSLH